MENLELSLLTVEQIAIIFNNVDLSNLQTIILKYDDLTNNIVYDKTFPSVRKVDCIHYGSHSDLSTYNFNSFISLFPNIAELNINCSRLAIKLGSLVRLENLRTLEICCGQLSKSTEFIRSISILPHLSTFILRQMEIRRVTKFTYGEHRYFKNLFVSLIRTNKKDEKLLSKSPVNKHSNMRKAFNSVISSIKKIFI